MEEIGFDFIMIDLYLTGESGLAQKSVEIIHPKKIAKIFEKQNINFSMSIFYYVSKLRPNFK